MSIEKPDFQSLIKESIPYTVIPNYVLQNVQDGFALGLWVYLLSLPHAWKVNKTQLMKHFKVGQNKLDNTLAYLAAMDLIGYQWERCALGKVLSVQIVVKNGAQFNDKHVKNQQDKKQSIHNHENHGTGKSVPIKEIENINKNKKLKSSCAPPRARANPEDGFDEFYEEYPRKKNKEMAKKAWIKHRCSEIKQKIIESVKNHKAMEPQWQDEIKFIPLPATFLNGKRWEDEIIPTKAKKETPLDRALRLASLPKPRVFDAEPVDVNKDLDKWGF